MMQYAKFFGRQRDDSERSISNWNQNNMLSLCCRSNNRKRIIISLCVAQSLTSIGSRVRPLVINKYEANHEAKLYSSSCSLTMNNHIHPKAIYYLP